MRVLIVHERFTELGGSERVVEQLARTFPNSSVFVPVAGDAGRPEGIWAAEVRTSPLQRLYRGDGRYAHLLPLLPLAMSRADLAGADVVITSHHAFSQRVRPAPGTAMVSYVHTPARWMWEADMRRGEGGGIVGEKLLGVFAASQRGFDRRAAARPHRIVANSHTVADRILHWWGRKSVVVHPPVRTEFFTPDPQTAREDFFLLAGRLVPYKRPEVAVEAARRAGVRLVVVGDGRSREACEAVAGSETQFVGRVDDEQMRDLMRRARALVFPGEEDFGIIPVEAMACGTPVVALAVGGALDTVVPGLSGVLVPPAPPGRPPPVEAFVEALSSFDDSSFDPGKVRSHAQTFAEERFRERMQEIVTSVVDA